MMTPEETIAAANRARRRAERISAEARAELERIEAMGKVTQPRKVAEKIEAALVRFKTNVTTLAQPRLQQEYRLPKSVRECAYRKETMQCIIERILHGRNCLRLEREAKGNKSTCCTESCERMKEELKHMTTCAGKTSCSRMDCSIYTPIIGHWDQCKNSNCIVCSPLRKSEEGGLLNQVAEDETEMNSEVWDGPSSASNLQTDGDSEEGVDIDDALDRAGAKIKLKPMFFNKENYTAKLTTNPKKWHDTCPLYSRNKNILRMVNVFQPNSTLELTTNYKTYCTIQCAREFEYLCFEKNICEVDYCMELYKKMEKINIERAERRRARKNNQQLLLLRHHRYYFYEQKRKMLAQLSREQERRKQQRQENDDLILCLQRRRVKKSSQMNK